MKISDTENSDKLALVPVQGNEVTLPNNELALPNNEVATADFLPVLEVQENEGTFEQVSDDGQSKQTVRQQQQMVLRGKNTNGQSVHIMEGLGHKEVRQENAEGKRVELTQEKTLKGVEITPTSQTQHELTEKRTAATVNMKDGTQAAELEAKRQETHLHKTEKEVLVKAATQSDKLAVKRDNQGLHQGVREQEELELHAQVSFDGSKQLSGKFRNVQLLSTETAAGTRIQFQQTKAFLGMDEDGELAIENPESVMVEFTLDNYLRDPKQFVQNEDVKNSFRGLLDILARQKKLPWGLGARILYKFGLVVFFLINFLYPIIVFAIKQEHAAYNIVCGIISFIGLVFELYETLPDLYRYIKKLKQKWRKRKEDRLVIAKPDGTADEAPQTEEEPTNEPAADNSEDDVDTLDYSKKVKRVLKEFVFDSFGELLIYPSIICSLYGFVNERGWEFNNAIAIFDFLLLLYGLVMDVFYAKVIHVWLLLKVIRTSYNVHDKYERVGSLGWKKIIERIVTPFSMTIPYVTRPAIIGHVGT